ncbi:MAG: hypothetical protein ACLP66_21045 [Polyangia bacterium]
MGTLGGFASPFGPPPAPPPRSLRSASPNPPAMVRRRQSRRAPHAIRSAFFCLLSVILLAGACADFRRGPPPDGSPDGPALVDDPVFDNSVYPILLSDCQSCHSQGGEAGFSRFVLTGNAQADRAMVVALVYPDYPDGSLLLQRATGNDHPGGQVIAVDSPEYATIRDWIASLPTAP